MASRGHGRRVKLPKRQHNEEFTRPAGTPQLAILGTVCPVELLQEVVVKEEVIVLADEAKRNPDQ